ncbi:UDP-N-acetylmuramyl-tripeptide synthetase family protein [[Clostridium] bifermentans ATCC 638]|uniref:UDP-N-acetylmuramoyl-L-alanyl-D-glutamate--2,6-diaminopimelate ligase n=1 Tax=Paraclostridium bifermentans ATCC 638 = DSM 14991 TaxID=1233171 RepID=T4VS09_PARBF|nr:UDP-N-acetylmuramoyl-L-alanyl-D-glutamate--2,6-diaminopimelate ligase [Paraclostridium bifermentans]EQK43900.1 UDP-N-acetylmuramyl-tripeptide synthetase family protein [[Clostridium] bifermentans ATCC 638] [Paraclostridium bifermentans ATCC 638 = DSM 14991]RIZ59408.1 UDP-N-acetylmuramoyl-L-alanyl-D-glutamate--2,6-diaminopimelate ligase [Paraclostridium bifermentans]UAG17724.1 UDP-N-acetylmuramoyl-L-alanyl-D-glutamate--2,6-diaminopimelate ligase [Paraclostridium bifermentans]
MLLKEVIKGLDILDTKGSLDIEIDNIQYDSRKVGENDLFICVKGFTVDGHKFIDMAIEKGAKAFLVQEDIQRDGVTFIKVKNTREDMAKVADNFYNHPSQRFDVIGVTGTNGKTSITTFLNEILTSADNKVGLIGTIKISDGDKEIESNSTTPESRDLQDYFDQMINNGCKYCAMEVSSHALALNRVAQTKYKVGVFTNLTPDHLDFHKDLEDYRNAKEKLFYMTTNANVINIDDEGGKVIYENIKKLDTKCYTYAIDHEADFMAKDIKIEARGVSYKLVTPTYEEDIFVPVPGKFTVYNTLAVIATCYALEIPKEIVLNGLKNTGGVAGRFEAISNETGISVIVDYAHTPDALENVIKTAREFVKNRIITVFGCGGDRDTTKRPLMGDIAQKLSDICIVTSDNPRTEDPELIINDILEGLDKSKENYKVVIDRKEAIKEAIEMAQKGDVILIAGKGHENYQVIGKVKHHFDDKEIANEFLQNK